MFSCLPLGRLAHRLAHGVKRGRSGASTSPAALTSGREWINFGYTLFKEKGQSMTTATLGKWGNATGLRIPQALCKQLGLAEGSDVSLSVEGRRLVVEPAESRYTIQARMRDWDGRRLQACEYDWGVPVGKELW